MLDTARKHERVVQVGAQQRPGEHYKTRPMNLIRNGALGPGPQDHRHLDRKHEPGLRPHRIKVGPDATELDWDIWLGRRLFVPVDPFRFAYNWRWFWDYSGGQMTNWGSA